MVGSKTALYLRLILLLFSKMAALWYLWVFMRYHNTLVYSVIISSTLHLQLWIKLTLKFEESLKRVSRMGKIEKVLAAIL